MTGEYTIATFTIFDVIQFIIDIIDLLIIVSHVQDIIVYNIRSWIYGKFSLKFKMNAGAKRIFRQNDDF